MSDVTLTSVHGDPFGDLPYKLTPVGPDDLAAKSALLEYAKEYLPEAPVQAHVQRSLPNDLADVARDPARSMFTRVPAALGSSLLNQAGNAISGVKSALTLPGDVLTGKVDPNSLEGLERSINMAGMLTLPADGKGDASAFGIFAGPKAATADLDALKSAKGLEQNNFPPEYIHEKTGWFKGTDGKWRFEIPDNTASYKTVPALGNRTVGKALTHEDLFNAYPDLKDMPLGKFTDSTAHGMYTPPRQEMVPPYGNTPGSDKISLSDVFQQNTPATNAAAKTTLLHELQHAVQTREGFAGGTNPQDPQVLKKFFNEGIQPEETYHRTAGEVESRNTELRQDLTPEERRKYFPDATQDVPRDKQFILTPVSHDPFPSLSTHNDPLLYQGVSSSRGNAVPFGEQTSPYWTPDLEKAKEYASPKGFIRAMKRSDFDQTSLINPIKQRKTLAELPYEYGQDLTEKHFFGAKP